MDLEIKHLRLVSAIARTGSVTRAGDLLNLSQSALSHQLRDIEDRLSVSLFHRVGKRMVLTTAGDALLRTATQVLDIVGRAEDEIRKAGKSEAGLLRITTQCYTCYHWLPGLLKEYRLRHPNVEVQVDADATPRPIKSLLEGRIDIGFVIGEFESQKVLNVLIAQDDYVALLPDVDRVVIRISLEGLAGRRLHYEPKHGLWDDYVTAAERFDRSLDLPVEELRANYPDIAAQLAHELFELFDANVPLETIKDFQGRFVSRR